jgi:hypothetical protein
MLSPGAMENNDVVVDAICDGNTKAVDVAATASKEAIRRNIVNYEICESARVVSRPGSSVNTVMMMIDCDPWQKEIFAG